MSESMEIERLRKLAEEGWTQYDSAQARIGQYVAELQQAHAERDALYVAVKAAEKMCMRSVERTVLPSPDEVLRLLSSCSAALAVVQPSG